MSVETEIHTACPDCGSTLLVIDFVAEAYVKFKNGQDAEDQDHEVIDTETGDIQWDDDSSTRCRHCSKVGVLSDFQKEVEVAHKDEAEV